MSAGSCGYRHVQGNDNENRGVVEQPSMISQQVTGKPGYQRGDDR